MVAGRANQAEGASLWCFQHERDGLDSRSGGKLGGKIGAGGNPGVRVEHSSARGFDFGDAVEVRR